MDQDSFRRLLVPAPRSDSLIPAGTIYESKKKAILDPSQPAFQPRKVTKKISKSEYRDRASERRSGVNEYAKVESVLEDFQRRTVGLEEVEAEKQRKYLGGDEDHTILVKGLDFALFEQNKSRATASNVDDDSLEAAFQESLETSSAVPRKRTREELLRELKAKRTAGGAGRVHSALMFPEADDALEKAKKVGKFKPIGALDSPSDKTVIKRTTGKAKQRAEEGGRKKKRRKVAHDLTVVSGKHPSEVDRSQPSIKRSPGPSTSAIKVAPLYPDAGTCIDEQATPHALEKDGDMDIFADVGEYEGIDFEAEGDDSSHTINSSPSVEGAAVSASSQNQGDMPAIGWFMEDEESITQPTLSAVPPPGPPAMPELPEEVELEQPTRLAPLASSALPSIRDFLAMDAQDGAKKKRRAKNDKKQAEKKGKVGAKIDRDYRRLNSYISKKGDQGEAS